MHRHHDPPLAAMAANDILVHMSRPWLLLLAAVALCAGDPEHVRIQLNWYHQFQFAGIYAAEQRGYFADEALQVEIAETRPRLDPAAELAAGRSQFAIYDSKIIAAWAQGGDIGLVAIIFQRNPSVLLVHADSPYLTLADALADRELRLVGPGGSMDPELRLALTALGRDADSVFPREKLPEDLDLFARRGLDLLPGYLSFEPHRLRRMGVEARVLRFAEEGRSPFFGDILVCRGDLLRDRPDLVARMRRAVLRGWEWALDNRQEMIAAIPARWPSMRQSPDPQVLADEAETVDRLIDRQVIPLGTISPNRLETIATTLRDAGLPGLVRRDLVWQPPDPDSSWVRVLLLALGLAAAACAVLVAVAWATRRRLIHTTISNQRLMDLAEAFFVFHARAEDGTRLRLIEASPSISSLLGGSHGTYRNDPDAMLRQVVPEDRQAFVLALGNAIAARHPLRHRFRLLRPGEQRPRHLLMHALPRTSSDPPEFDGLVLDLTAEADAAEALLEVQRRLQTAQRNESLGLLAGGVAHDFNNLLGAIRGNAELAMARLPAGSEARPRIERVLQAADRAAGLVKQILAYAGKGSIEIRPIDLAEECRVLGDLLRHAVGKDIAIKLEVDGQPPQVLFDPAQLQQVLVNLIVNAAEAYGSAAGTVTVRVARDREHDRMVRVEIIDQGCGMDAETQSRMFEPYFTTKKTGHGLGLAAVQGICKAAGARLHCSSAPGRGTTFTVLMPIAAESGQQTSHRTPRPAAGRHLLVVDDDELMRETVVQMAQQLGYSVDVAAGGVEAARLLADPARTYAAAVIDCVMPDRDGTEVVRELRLAGDRRPMVLMSGMVEAGRIGTGILDRKTRFLAKPFSKAMFERTLLVLLRPEPGDAESGSSTTFAAMQRESSLHAAIRPDTPPSDAAP